MTRSERRSDKVTEETSSLRVAAKWQGGDAKLHKIGPYKEGRRWDRRSRRTGSRRKEG